MEELVWHEHPALREPIMVCAFEGWNDAADASTLALAFLRDGWRAEQPSAEIDPEGFFDFQSTRPHVKVLEGRSRELSWPQNRFYVARPEGAGRDLVLLAGVEPNLRWKAFCDLVLGAAAALGTRLVVTLGALLADVPHTRAVPVTGIASDSELAQRLGLPDTRYEGPTGIVGALHGACVAAEVASVSFWAAVPHYVGATSNAKAALVLARRVIDLAGAPLDTTELEEAGEEYERQVSAAVASNPKLQELVEELERRADAGQQLADIPSGESLAREFQRFLRERGDAG